MKSYKDLKEEIANVAGPPATTNIAGLGLEPPMRLPKKKKRKNKYIYRRKNK